MQLSLLEFLSETPEPVHSSSKNLTSEKLIPFLPKASIKYILNWFGQNPVKIRIAPSRNSKFGDYRPSVDGSPAIISVNKNLNPYDFLITLVHEMAHHSEIHQFMQLPKTLFRRRKPRPKPHGEEWKKTYFYLMVPLMNSEVFPDDILAALLKYFEKTTVSHNASQRLTETLKKYDQPDGKEFLKDLMTNDIFYIPGGRAFRKMDQIRKRFRCVSLDNRKIYLFSPVARVSRAKA